MTTVFMGFIYTILNQQTYLEKKHIAAEETTQFIALRPRGSVQSHIWFLLLASWCGVTADVTERSFFELTKNSDVG